MKKSLLLFFLVLFCSVVQALAQSLTVTGKVTSAEDGGPMPGVTVKIANLNVGTQTDANGNYTIKVASGQTLVFSFIGTTTQQFVITASRTLNVALKADNRSLNEVVVTAYNINRDKASLGYSTPVVKGDEVAETQRNDFFGGLQGRVPGLSINSTNGNPGASAQIVLRGFTSMSGDNNALIVIDGVPINNSTLNQTSQLVSGAANRDADYSNRAMDINPNDIETYTIMKGPEATALFGSAGAGGAILITTKRGKAGTASINYNNSFRTERLYRFPEIQTTYNTGTTGGVFDPTSSNFFGPTFLPNTPLYDNFEQFFQNGTTQKHNLAIDGGSEKATYRWSNEYTDTKGTIPNTTYTRFSTRLTGTIDVAKFFKITTTLSYANVNNKKAYKGPNGVLIELMRFSPAFDILKYEDANGNRILHQSSIFGEYSNPLWSVNKDPQEDKNDRFIGNVNFTITPTKWMSVTAIFGADIAATNGFNVYHPQSYRGSGSATAPTGGTYQQYQQLAKLYNGTLTASAKGKWGDFNGTLILGGTISSFNSTTDSQLGNKFYDPNFYSINNTLPTTRLVNTAINQYRTVGAFSQAVLGYKSLLYLTVTGRVDGLSRLMTSVNANSGLKPDSDPYFAYPSASLAFNFTEIEPIKKAMSFMDYGKLRISYGVSGKGPLRDYAMGSNYVGANTTGGGYALSVNGGNPNLKPEKTKNFETGVEMQFFHNRLGLDFNYYNLRSEDQIINPRVSYGSGFVLQLMNGGIVRNRGIEIQLTGAPIRKTNFEWNTTLNFTMNRGIVLSIADELPELYDSDTQIIGAIRSASSPGSSVGNVNGTRLDRNKAGQILINPLNGMPIQSDATYVPIADRLPKFNAGLVNQIRYKNLSLSFLWDLRYGGDVINQTEFEAYTKGISTKTLDRETPRVITGVLRDGLENTANPTVNTIAITPYATSSYYTTNVATEMFVERNIKALRLRDATLNYNFPAKVLSRTGFIKTASVFFTVTDAILISNYSGLDPESNSLNASSGGIGGFGIDYGNIGKPIGFNLGLRVKL